MSAFACLSQLILDLVGLRPKTARIKALAAAGAGPCYGEQVHSRFLKRQLSFPVSRMWQ